MFTGIIQAIATVTALHDREGLRTMRLEFSPTFCADLKIGASVAVEGVCLTVTQLHGDGGADFDIMSQTLATTTLGELVVGSEVNVERAAKQGVEIGGHSLSGHIDCCGIIADIQQPPHNYMLRVTVPSPFLRYLFPKGYVALNGASLTISQINREESWVEIWLIPETLRATTFRMKKINDRLNVEIDRNTQVVVDTIYAAVNDCFERLKKN